MAKRSKKKQQIEKVVADTDLFIPEEKEIPQISEPVAEEIVQEEPIEEQVISEEPIVIVENKEEVVQEYVNPNWVRILEEIEEYQASFNVSKKEAIMLLQKVLDIKQSGELDQMTKSAFESVYSYSDLINDYRNQRK